MLPLTMRHPRLSAAALLLACVVFVAFSACQAPSKPAAPAPAVEDWKIGGNHLESASLGFRISAPEGWTWSEDTAQRNPADEQYSFVARLDPRTFFRLTVRGRQVAATSEKSMAEYLEGVRISNEKSGIVVTEVASAPRSTPAGAGYSYSYRMQLPQGSALADGFLLGAGRLYMLQYISTDRAQLAAFQHFADSLELLEKPAG